MAVVQAEQLLQFAVNALCKVGLSEEKAATIGSALVDADLRGIHSHGVHNLPRYARGFMQGHLNMNPSFPLIVDNGIFAIVDGPLRRMANRRPTLGRRSAVLCCRSAAIKGTVLRL